MTGEGIPLFRDTFFGRQDKGLMDRINIDLTRIRLNVQRTITTYTLPDHVLDVYQLWLPSSRLAGYLGGGDTFSDAYQNAFGVWYAGQYGSGDRRGMSDGAGAGQDQYPLSNLVQGLQYSEMVSRIWGSDVDYRYDRRLRVLNIMPSPYATGPAILSVNSSMLSTNTLDPEDEDLFLRICMVEAKKRLGRIRSKYDTVPTVGGDRNLDGDKLLDEAVTELEKLEEDVLNRKLPDMTYIFIG